MLIYLWAEDENHLIGANGTLPWHLPADMHHFKTLTTGQTVLMGRKTWDSLPHGALKDRTNLVVTRQDNFSAPDALVLSGRVAIMNYDWYHVDENIYVIGGSQIFELLKDQVDQLEVTRIGASFDGDVYMPDLDWTAFKRIKQNAHPAAGKNAYPYTFETYTRVAEK
ncbi:dfrA protein [Lactobacillus selangorensis]|uniref:Dihydrofolate reductase n=1 Tax=Lactobacillus selangorensis TaxID=81857 RepID=A0A0R2FW09_9LACO|nr:dihydrofolate reductase [Lactobacillus selangorensis]KRN29450.1 dfrA protein [Lactobacillus selangorensis]KRN34021.1 dfrA protein [Lactobacillus selangorensis]